MATEIQEISQEKVRIKKIMSEKYVSPLTQQARLQYLNSGEPAEKKDGANPVLVMSKGNPLRKKKKVYKYDFINSRTKKWAIKPWLFILECVYQPNQSNCCFQTTYFLFIVLALGCSTLFIIK